MNPYAGDPNSFPLTVGLVDDVDLNEASNFDVVGENLADRTAWLRARMVYGATSFQPLPTAASFSGGFNWAYAYDATPSQKRWLCVANELVTNVQQLYWTSDGASYWNQLGSSGFGASTGFIATSIGVDPSTGIISLIHAGLYRKVTPAGVYSGGSLPLGIVVAPYGAVTGWEIHNGTRFFKGLYVAVGIADTANAPFQKFGVVTSPDAVTWTDRSTAIPAAQVIASNKKDVLACNANHMVVYAPGGGFQFVHTSDGLTWSSVAVPAMVAGDIVTGIAWSEADQIFLACCTALSDNVTSGYILKSANGTSWSKIATLTGGYQPCAIENVGLIWLCLVGEPGSTGDHVMRVLLSSDFGQTWALSPCDFASGTSFLPKLYSSGNQFLIGGASIYRASLYIGEVPAGL